MTTQEMLAWTCAYLVELVAVVYFTRATYRRVVGALIGGAVVGVMELGAMTFFQVLGLWRLTFSPGPWFALVFCLGLVAGSAPIYLLTWRTARRFGGRGLAVFIATVAAIGPPRDYLIAATFPKWMVFAPGLAPVLADCATYIGIVALGHAVMRMIAGPSCGDRLARSAKEAA